MIGYRALFKFGNENFQPLLELTEITHKIFLSLQIPDHGKLAGIKTKRGCYKTPCISLL